MKVYIDFGVFLYVVRERERERESERERELVVMPSTSSSVKLSSSSSKQGVMKHGSSQQRTSITIVVMGDMSVGKSSLISTFVSRHFSEVVPGIMTRVRLPPDTSTYMPYVGAAESSKHAGFVTTIVDTQGADASLLAALTAAGVSGGFNLSSPLVYSSPSSSLTSLSKVAATPTPTPADADADADPVTQESISNEKTTSSSGTPPLPPTGTGTGTATGRLVLSMDVDVIVLVYDLDRLDTFYRLENHWLPLIERCFGQEVSGVE